MRHNTQESTAIVSGSALPNSQMVPRNVSLQSPESGVSYGDVPEDDQPRSAIHEAERGPVGLWDQFLRKGKKKIGVRESLRAIVFSSCMLTILDKEASD